MWYFDFNCLGPQLTTKIFRINFDFPFYDCLYTVSKHTPIKNKRQMLSIVHLFSVFRCPVEFDNMFPDEYNLLRTLPGIRSSVGIACDKNKQCPTYSLLSGHIVSVQFYRDGSDETHPVCYESGRQEHRRVKRGIGFNTYQCLGKVRRLCDNNQGVF